MSCLRLLSLVDGFASHIACAGDHEVVDCLICGGGPVGGVAVGLDVCGCGGRAGCECGHRQALAAQRNTSGAVEIAAEQQARGVCAGGGGRVVHGEPVAVGRACQIGGNGFGGYGEHLAVGAVEEYLDGMPEVLAVNEKPRCGSVSQGHLAELQLHACGRRQQLRVARGGDDHRTGG